MSVNFCSAMKRAMIQQRGAISVVVVMLIAIVVVTVLTMSMHMANTGLNDTQNQSDSIAALYLAESGIERATWRFATTGLCDNSLAEGPINLAGNTFTINDIGAGFSQDFSANPLSSSQCRLQSTGIVPRSNTRRTLEAIVDSNLVGSANADFNDPPGAGPPNGWTFSLSGANNGEWYDNTGGPDGSRSAYLNKPNNGGGAANGAGSFNLAGFTVSAPVTLTVNFDYKVLNGNSPNSMQLTFSLSDGVTTFNSVTFQDSNTGGVYKSGSTSLVITGSSSLILTSLSFNLVAKSGQSNQIWLDNIVITGGGGGGNIVHKSWREMIY
jgi:hypothetical protein